MTPNPRTRVSVELVPRSRSGLRAELEARLRSILDPEAVDRLAKADQAAAIAAHGGEDAIRKVVFDNPLAFWRQSRRWVEVPLGDRDAAGAGAGTANGATHAVRARAY